MSITRVLRKLALSTTYSTSQGIVNTIVKLTALFFIAFSSVANAQAVFFDGTGNYYQLFTTNSN